MNRISLEKAFSEAKARFEERVTSGWTTRSILLSEGFSLCAFCSYYGIERLIESGIYNGRSTEIWCQYLDPSIEIIALDKEIRPEAKDRLGKFPNIQIKVANSIKDLPGMSKSLKRTGIFIDGPKGQSAVDLARECFKNENVCFVGVHDLHTMSLGIENISRIYSNKWEGMNFYTDAEWFVDAYKYLDSKEQGYDEGQQITWTPYEIQVAEGKPKRKLGSYGPTIGYVLR